MAGFKPHPITGRCRIKVVGCEQIDDLYKPLGDQTEIHIVPQLSGGKKGGFMQIVIGAALVAAAFIPGVGPMISSMLFKAGAMMMLGGVAQLLSPQPEDDKGEIRNRYLGAPKNTVKIGTRIPILYGRFRCYGHYLSMDINAGTSTEPT